MSLPFRTPGEDAYLMALGRATFIFASLEWNVIGIGERFDPGFIYASAKMPAGSIAQSFILLLNRIELKDEERRGD